ncbi:MAG: hypothetical protein BMS9Abin12_1502 [Acidimicrobiia bacterium]|nr:MAG: hypothetical protein BMS9Abin12_1502 [Acidimicrobiia bacterium]
MLENVKNRSNLLIAAALVAFPLVWSMLVVSQATYYGPMRGLFTKITRRYLDDLPFGWALFDVLFYLLPAIAFVLLAIGLGVREDRKLSHPFTAVIVAVIVVVVIRRWGPGYL